MVPSLRSLAFAAIVPLALSAPLRAGGVHIVGNPGAGVFFDIQSAVDAASDGDVLLAGDGTYEPFTIDGKGVSLFAASPGRARIAGTVFVRNVARGSHVVLADLEITGAQRYPQSDTALVLEGNAGQVRLERCRLIGGAGLPENEYCSPHGSGGHAVVATNCPRLSFAECTLAGGDAYQQLSGNYKCNGGSGGDGLRAAAAAAALYHCSLVGGRGGTSGFFAGDGGNGCVANFGGLVAVESSFRGGQGGNAWDVFGFGGDGGHGLYLYPGTQAQLVDNRFFAGTGGSGFNQNGENGAPTAGSGVFRYHPGKARRFSTSRGVFADFAGAGVAVSGEHGDFVWVPMSFRPGWRIPQPVRGIWMIPLGTKMPLVPFGVLPASGTLNRTLALPDIQVDGMLLYTQGWALDVERDGHIGGPMNMLVLNRDGQPDCDGDGMQDFLQILFGLAPDCDDNLVPDACDPDCNANGVVDGCDVLNGTSPDLNRNGVPDECEAGATWYVDAAAPPGGDGSAGAPFQTIGRSIAASVSGDTVIVLDGTYTGAENRALELGGRDLVVRSQNGPAACIIDCLDADRAFWIHEGETRGARIEGFTIRNGSPYNGRGGGILVEGASPTISGCVIEGCVASGGGIYIEGGAPFVEDCWLSGNGRLSGPSVSGGGINVRAGQATILRCTIEGNQAAFGGGVFVGGGIPTPSVLLSHCRILANRANHDGGGVGVLLSSLPADLFVDDCLIAGNQAGSGGGLYFRKYIDTPNTPARLQITGCTFAANMATDRGGAVYADFGDTGSLANSVLWGSTASSGLEIELGADFQPGGFSVSWSDLKGGQGKVVHSGGLAWGPGNIALDPLFTDPDGPDNDPSTFGDNDYSLGTGSPCIDAADNLSVPPDRADVDGDLNLSEPVPLDLALAPRFVDDPAVPDTGNGTPPVVDMGAYERP